MVKVYTAQYRYPGENRLDITVKGKDPIGKVFAPTWDMVKAFKKTGNEQAYIHAYHQLILKSFQYNKVIWNQVLAMDKVVFVCFCPSDGFCHRFLLANYFNQLGAWYGGELSTDPPAIKQFQNEYRWLSNFWLVPFIHQGIQYKSVEHFYQAWKFPVDKRAKIAMCHKPKQEGKKAQLPHNWDQIKVDIMREGLRLKFQNPEMREKLLATKGRLLIEGNYWHDNFWGDCYCKKCTSKPGKNMLGKLLMEIRDEL